jgi:hypothetical protein
VKSREGSKIGARRGEACVVVVVVVVLVMQATGVSSVVVIQSPGQWEIPLV